MNLSVRIYETYQNRTKDVLEQNPYKLVEDVAGVGFRTADKIAQKKEVSGKSELDFFYFNLVPQFVQKFPPLEGVPQFGQKLDTSPEVDGASVLGVLGVLTPPATTLVVA